MAINISRCSATVRDDGSLLYEAGIRYDGDDQPWAEVEWYINGELAARDGPLSIGGFESNFQQPREDAFTENEFLVYETEADVRNAFGTGDHTVTVDAYLSGPA